MENVWEEELSRTDQRFKDWSLLRNNPQGWHELERALFAIVLSLDDFAILAPLSASDFYSDKHQKAIGWVLERGAIPTMSDVLLAANPDLTELLLTTEVVLHLPVTMAADLVTVIREFSRRRKYRSLLEKAADAGSTGDVARSRALLSEAVSIEHPITQEQSNGLSCAIARRVAALQDRNRPTLSFGFPALDRVIGDISDGGLFMIGARTSVGKSTLALSLATKLARSAVVSALISLEDDERKLADRVLATALNVNVDTAQSKIAAGEFSKTAIEAAVSISSKILLYTPRTNSLENVLASITQAGKLGARVVFLDYIHEVQVPSDMVSNHEWPVAVATKAVKELCRHLNMTAVVFAQMVKPSYGQEFVRPELREIRDSQRLADVAEWAMVIWRTSKDEDAKVFGRIEKNKNGRTGVTLQMVHAASRVMFCDIVRANDEDLMVRPTAASWTGKM